MWEIPNCIINPQPSIGRLNIPLFKLLSLALEIKQFPRGSGLRLSSQVSTEDPGAQPPSCSEKEGKDPVQPGGNLPSGQG